MEQITEEELLKLNEVERLEKLKLIIQSKLKFVKES